MPRTFRTQAEIDRLVAEMKAEDERLMRDLEENPRPPAELETMRAIQRRMEAESDAELDDLFGDNRRT